MKLRLFFYSYRFEMLSLKSELCNVCCPTNTPKNAPRKLRKTLPASCSTSSPGVNKTRLLAAATIPKLTKKLPRSHLRRTGSSPGSWSFLASKLGNRESAADSPPTCHSRQQRGRVSLGSAWQQCVLQTPREIQDSMWGQCVLLLRKPSSWKPSI